MFELSIKTHFSAAHRLEGYDGPCANQHGHNWAVEVYEQGESLNELGMLIDFKDIKSAVRKAMEEVDHRDLNQLPAFMRENPTSENLARYLYEQLSGFLNSKMLKVSKVTVCETPGTTASYWSDGI
jgi:6-pyruvoyltetrahydropterin/6-carboxytetrahydropterin synthase